MRRTEEVRGTGDREESCYRQLSRGALLDMEESHVKEEH